MSTEPEQSRQHTAETAPHSSQGRGNVRRGKLLGTLVAVAFLAGALGFLWSQWSQLNQQSQSFSEENSGPPSRFPLRVFDLSKTSVPRKEILLGTGAVDSIPSLSEAKFVSAKEVTFLKPKDRVIGVVFDKTAKAYPLKILNYHEAVNDKVGDVPYAVTYCPLCDSAAVFDRRTQDGVIEFGISGLLYNSNVLLYDRQKNDKHQSLWSQMKTKSVAGPKRNASLKTLPLELTTWRDWSARYPETKVLSTKTGHRRNYARQPYASYFDSRKLMFPAKPLDKRLPLKSRVLGVWSNKTARAYPISAFEQQKQPVTLEQTLDGRSFTLNWNPEAQSLRVSQADDGLQWVYSFWFAWAAFHEQSEIYKP